MATSSPRIRAVAIVVRGDQVLLMHRRNLDKEYYVFPGGGVEAEETVQEAVIRELHEEASLEIDIRKLLYHHVYDDGSEQFFYLCDWISGEPQLGAGNESQEMAAGLDQYYQPGWHAISSLKDLLVYPLEIRDWLLEDWENGFLDAPREAFLKIAQLRRTI